MSTPAMMKAVVQEGYGSEDVLRLRTVPVPAVAANHVLVRVRAASINAMDYHLMHGLLPLRLFLGVTRPKSAIRGVDVAGVVEGVGSAVTRWKPGDEVFGIAKGAFAEYAAAAEDRLVSKPVGLSFEQAAAVPLAAITALQALQRANVGPGTRVVIHGAGGGVGTFAVQIAKALGAHVTAVTGPRNLDVVATLGADQLIDYSREDVTRSARKWDVFFDNAATRSLRDCLRVLEPRGTYLGVGAPKDGMWSIVTGLLGSVALRPFVSQRIVTLLARSNAHDLETLVELIESGRVAPVIDREYPLAEVPEAIRYMSAGQARAKVVIRV